jgi:hypothetical protein
VPLFLRLTVYSNEAEPVLPEDKVHRQISLPDGRDQIGEGDWLYGQLANRFSPSDKLQTGWVVEHLDGIDANWSKERFHE